MTVYPNAFDIEMSAASGPTYRGTLRADGTTPADDLIPPMPIGMSVHPDQYTRWFNAVSPGHPAFARVFSPPGAGLPNLAGPAIADLPHGTLPWISHKDRVPVASLVAYWDSLRDLYKPQTGRFIRWTPQHEHAPAADRLDYLGYLADVATAARTCPWIDVVQVQSDYAMRWRADTRWHEWLLPEISVGFDCYPPVFGTGYEPPESMFSLLIYAAGAIGAPRWYVPELGAEVRVGDAAARAAWITACATHLDEQGCSGLGLWCGDPEVRDDHTYDYRPTDTPTLKAYSALLTPDPAEITAP